MIRRARWLYPALYLSWTALCAILFVALSGLEDPARPKGRILSIEAGQRALALARARGYEDYEVVHVARARAGEGGSSERWVVLLDRVPHTGLRESIVIELRAGDGRLVGMRRAMRFEGRMKNEEFQMKN